MCLLLPLGRPEVFRFGQLLIRSSRTSAVRSAPLNISIPHSVQVGMLDICLGEIGIVAIGVDKHGIAGLDAMKRRTLAVRLRKIGTLQLR